MFADPWTLALCGLAIFAGGLVKGISGIGLPLVALPLLTVVVDLPTAVTLLSLPIVATNMAQAAEGRALLTNVRRFRLFLVVFAPAIFVGAHFLLSVDQRTLFAVVGAVLAALTLLLRFARNIRIGRRAERIVAPLAAMAAGMLGGVSALFGPPIMVYLLGLRLTKDEFVPAVSMLYLTGSLVLVGSLIWLGRAGAAELGRSALAMAPVFAGLYAGQAVRARLTARSFDGLLFAVYMLTAASFLYKGLA